VKRSPREQLDRNAPVSKLGSKLTDGRFVGCGGSATHQLLPELELCLLLPCLRGPAVYLVADCGSLKGALQVIEHKVLGFAVHHTDEHSRNRGVPDLPLLNDVAEHLPATQVEVPDCCIDAFGFLKSLDEMMAETQFDVVEDVSQFSPLVLIVSAENAG